MLVKIDKKSGIKKGRLHFSTTSVWNNSRSIGAIVIKMRNKGCYLYQQLALIP